MADELALLSDDELRSKLRHFNLPDGPITKTTRKIFERKLQRALKPDSEIDEPDSTRQSIVKETSSLEPKHHVEQTNNATDARVGEKLAEELPPSDIYYGVCLQPDEGIVPNPRTPLVFTEKSEALLSVKKNSGARFKAFNNRNEAKAFAYGNAITPSSHQVSPVLIPKSEDPIGNYRAPKPEEIVRFRKLIERGELGQLLELIYENPKYLISSGDTPVILQAGFRYNAMHVAAKVGKRDVCKLIVHVLENDDFWKLLYPSDEKNMKDEHVNSRRKMFVLDMYLNTCTPDKGGCETPLHFACKFGKADVVEYLLTCSGTDRTLLNIYGETPFQVICNRVPDCPEELRTKIQNMFTKEDIHYVPILRSDDNCCSPKVGAPCSSACLVRSPEVHCNSPGEPRYHVSAYAGPMSPQEANKFTYTLKSPWAATPEKRTKFRNIKRSDSEKGLERVARKLAKSQSVAWCEYWKFLDSFCDLSTKDGLTKLEEYLRVKKEIESCTSNGKKWHVLRTPVSGKRSLGTHGLLDGDDFVFEQEDGALEPGYEVRGNHHTPTGRNRNMKGFRNRLQWDESTENDKAGVDENERHDLLVGDKLNCSDQVSNANLPEQNCRTVSEIDVSPRMDNTISVIENCSTSMPILSEEERQSRNEREELVEELHSTYDELPLHGDIVSLNVSGSSEDSLLGLPSVFQKLSLQGTPSPEIETRIVSSPTNNESPPVSSGISNATSCTRAASDGDDISLFIEGFQPSKIDLDVLRAIKSAKINPAVFPNVCQWQKVVRSFAKNTREAWLGPGSPRYHRNRRVISSTWSY